MAKSNMDQDILKVLLSEEEIKARVQELGDRLYDRFKDKNPMFVGVLNGCFIFMADLVRAAQLKSEVEFIGLSSYKNATKSSGVVQITRDLQRDISGRDIIIVEDILDSGNTLYFLTEYLKTKGAASVTIATLLDKPAAKSPLPPTMPASRSPTSLWWAMAWTTASSTGICPILGSSSPRSTASKTASFPPILRYGSSTYTRYAVVAAPRLGEKSGFSPRRRRKKSTRREGAEHPS